MKSADDLTLAEAVDLIVYGANCRACKETRQIDLHQLLERFGPDFIVYKILPKLRCTKCGSRQIICVTLWKEAATTERLMEHWISPQRSTPDPGA